MRRARGTAGGGSTGPNIDSIESLDHVREEMVELTQAEQWMIAFLYNMSLRGGEITAGPCCAAYGVDIHLNDGSKMSVYEGVFSKMIVDLPQMYASDRFYTNCPLLVDYIYVLAEKYDLPIEEKEVAGS